MSEWIRVVDRLPAYGETVILCSRNGVVQDKTYFLDGGGDFHDKHTVWWQCSEDEVCLVAVNEMTHWMPLPEPPKDGQ